MVAQHIPGRAQEPQFRGIGTTYVGHLLSLEGRGYSVSNNGKENGNYHILLGLGFGGWGLGFGFWRLGFKV